MKNKVEVLVFKLEIKILFSNSLKDKRMLLNSLKQMVLNKFNIVILEIGNKDSKTYSLLSGCFISEDKNYLLKMINELVIYIEQKYDIEVIDTEYYIEIY